MTSRRAAREVLADYSGRAYRRDPEFPDSPAIADAAARFILDAVRRSEADEERP
jgi:hypothetical protein